MPSSLPSMSGATQILIALERDKDLEPVARLADLVYVELRRLAGRLMRRERQNHTLQPTALVNEAYLRLIDQTQVEWQNRRQFIGIAAEMMRRVLVDHARRRASLKQGGDRARVSLSGLALAANESSLDILALDAALDELARLNERQARVVVLRFFGGLSVEDVAGLLGVSPGTVKGDWRLARAWLRDRIDG